MSAQPFLEIDSETSYTDDECVTEPSDIEETKKIGKRGKRANKKKTSMKQRIRLRTTAIEQVISDELRMWMIIARCEGNFELSKALNSKIEVWRDIYSSFHDDVLTKLPSCDKAKNDAKRWELVKEDTGKMVDNIFNFFREVCDILPSKRRARAASSLFFRLISSIYDSVNQGAKAVFNKTLVDTVPNFTLDHMLEKFSELVPLHAQIVESWPGDQNGDSASSKEKLIHFRRVMESLYALTSVTAMSSPGLCKTTVPLGLNGMSSSHCPPSLNMMDCCPNVCPTGMSAMSADPSGRSYSFSQQTKHLYFRPQEQPKPRQFHWPSQQSTQANEPWQPQLPPPVSNTFNPSFSTQSIKKPESTIGFENAQSLRPNGFMSNPWMPPNFAPSPFFG